MRVAELRVADVGEAVVDQLVPAVAQLREPEERLRAVDLLGDQFADDVARVHVDRADGHDLLAVAAAQLADEQVDEGGELADL